jgi:hypothetical protein
MSLGIDGSYDEYEFGYSVGYKIGFKAGYTKHKIENQHIDCASIMRIVDAADEIVSALYKQGANKDYKCKHLREKLNEIRKELTGDGGTG